jgi:lipoprotein Spr
MVNPKQLLHFYLITLLKRSEIYLLLVCAVLVIAARPTLEESATAENIPSLEANAVEVVPATLPETASLFPVVLSKTDSLLRLAQSLIGVPYRYAGKRPAGFDCSGFTRYVFRRVGTDIGAASRHQYRQGVPVTIAESRPGDLIFFSSHSRISHVGVISSRADGKVYFIHASSSRGVVTDCLDDTYFRRRLAGVRRVLPS